MTRLAVAASLLFAATTLSPALQAQRPGGETGVGQNAPDSHTVRTVDERLNHPAKNHRKRVCTIHRSGSGKPVRRCNWQ